MATAKENQAFIDASKHSYSPEEISAFVAKKPGDGLTNDEKIQHIGILNTITTNLAKAGIPFGGAKKSVGGGAIQELTTGMAKDVGQNALDLERAGVGVAKQVATNPIAQAVVPGAAPLQAATHLASQIPGASEAVEKIQAPLNPETPEGAAVQDAVTPKTPLETVGGYGAEALQWVMPLSDSLKAYTTAAKGAKAVEATGMAEKLWTSILNMTDTQARDLAPKVERAVNFLISEKLFGSRKQIVKKVGLLKQEFETNVKKATKSVTGKVAQIERSGVADAARASAERFKNDTENYAINKAHIDKAADYIMSKKFGKYISPDRLHELLRNAGANARNVKSQVTSEVSEALRDTYKTILDSKLAKAGVKIGDKSFEEYTKKYSDLLHLDDILYKTEPRKWSPKTVAAGTTLGSAIGAGVGHQVAGVPGAYVGGGIGGAVGGTAAAAIDSPLVRTLIAAYPKQAKMILAALSSQGVKGVRDLARELSQGESDGEGGGGISPEQQAALDASNQ